MFHSNYNVSLNGIEFPKNMVEFTFPSNYNSPIDLIVFPKNMFRVKFGRMFNKSIDCLKKTNLTDINLSESIDFD